MFWTGLVDSAFISVSTVITGIESTLFPRSVISLFNLSVSSFNLVANSVTVILSALLLRSSFVASLV